MDTIRLLPRSVPPMKDLAGLLDIFRSDQQFGSPDRRVHSAGVVGPNHRIDSGIIQNSFRDLRIRRGSECRDDNQI
jgi:hypothetical protein